MNKTKLSDLYTGRKKELVKIIESKPPHVLLGFTMMIYILKLYGSTEIENLLFENLDRQVQVTNCNNYLQNQSLEIIAP